MDFPQNEPQLTWDTIMLIVKSYPEAAFYDKVKTEAQEVCGILAAGAVEDLLSIHGPTFIEQFEIEARLDRRVAWVLGGTRQFQMAGEIWDRVQRAADHTYWNRKTN